MKMCLKIYPPTREDIINFYHLFKLKDLNEKKFSILMDIFNMTYSIDKTFFENYKEKNFFLFDGNSHIEIQLDKDWINSGYKENPNRNKSKTYYVLGFSFIYFQNFGNSKLAQIRFPSNRNFMLSIKNGILYSNLSFKNNIEIPLLENKDYSFTMTFFQDRIQIYINETSYETEIGIEETAKNIIIGDKFFGIFYN